jgi:hypothetical protein
MVAPIRTYMEADVKCYLCGHISGVARVERGADRQAMFVVAGSEVSTPIDAGRNLRCLRCNGPTFFDEFEIRHEYPKIDFLDGRPRRGRPPKRLAERQGAA